MKRILLLSQDPRRWIQHRPPTHDEFNKIYNNTGNLVWQYGIAKVLHHPRNQVTIERHPYDIHDCDLPLTQGAPEAVNDQFDHVVFSGANVISRRQVWRLERLMPLLLGLQVPLTVCSIGAQADHGDYQLLHGIEGIVKKFVGIVLDRSPSIGVRGAFTAEYLSSLGFSKYVKIIGCPSFYMGGEKATFASPEHKFTDEKALIGDTPNLRARLYRKAVKIFGSSFDVVSQSYVEQDTQLDVEELIAIREGRLHSFTTFHEWKAFAQKHSVSLSGRIHGTVVALHAGIPAVLIAHDKRTQELGQHLGVPMMTMAQLRTLKSREQLVELWRESKVQTNYKAGFQHFIQYLNEHKLTHWETDGSGNLAGYYDGLLGRQSVSTVAVGSLVTYPASHPVYSRVPAYLASKFLHTTAVRLLAETKQQVKKVLMSPHKAEKPPAA